jgi:hypothetical protein
MSRSKAAKVTPNWSTDGPEWCTGISWLVYLFLELKTGAALPRWFWSPCVRLSRLPRAHPGGFG